MKISMFKEILSKSAISPKILNIFERSKSEILSGGWRRENKLGL
jgi:hypothetical protein